MYSKVKNHKQLSVQTYSKFHSFVILHTKILDLKAEKNNLYTSFDQILPRDAKENLLNQRGLTIWMTGLSGSGKTTIGIFLEKKLHEKGIITKILDGDNIRVGINKNLRFSEKDRIENIRRIAEVSKLFVECGIVSINCFVSPTNSLRKMARSIIGENAFLEIFITECYVQISVAKRRETCCT